ncbi:triose-phosphate isomerase [Candidatus Uhrbacteria bacterium RIFCSPHIGHO2_02_FULL_60_10]|uniref:Triosephosphate isomerase n=1 Tax=Candidatus Uhrbacteria bacterium RIFCSPHIGHO2_02_FULL_60_10 TaxID=1802392 RepID=A0A1F7U7P0_9BACT|nr:MAG: triose-phosphate isomerase [Candidatus Uhrbacteria bacterium RIFCSPHIGHO2_02_FULL_60_10]
MPTFIIGNWKMQLSVGGSVALAKEIVRLWSAQGAQHPDVQAVVCPTHLALDEVASVVRGTSVALGAQDVFWEEKGAYTGEISPLMLKDLGCEYCLVGHSERRQFLGETDAMVAKKVTALLKAGINPVVCVGETREERDAGKRDAVVIGQVRVALKDVRPVGKQRLVVAYEPRWAIGAGTPVSPDDAASMHFLIRETLLEMMPKDVVERQCGIVYGGSVDAKNIASFLAKAEIHGGLIGGASLKAPDFVRMAETAVEVKRA